MWVPSGVGFGTIHLVKVHLRFDCVDNGQGFSQWGEVAKKKELPDEAALWSLYSLTRTDDRRVFFLGIYPYVKNEMGKRRGRQD